MSLIALALAFVGMTSCRQELAGAQRVTFDNQLTEELSLYEDGKFGATLSPLSVTTTVMYFAGQESVHHLDVRTRDGRLVYSADVRPKMLQAQGWKIVISDKPPTATP